MENVRQKRRNKPIAIWLLVGVIMIIVQIILGGITRLTDSGLSITEWKPLLGTIPPTTETEWAEAFDRYKKIAQYKHLHHYFTLENFKSIFFWEWLHRVWGRLIGLVFLIPFVIFIWQKRFSRGMIKPMVVLFLLGALQGIIGWLMVKSGLNDDNLYVSHIRLAIHFMAALALLVYTLWFALQLLVNKEQYVFNPTSKKMLAWIICFLIIQLFYGAFMAGLKAAMAAPTWPDINGHYLPDITHYGGKKYPLYASLLNNPMAIQFIHRTIAYVLVILIFIWSLQTARYKGSSLFNAIKWMPLLVVIGQIFLGIAAVITSIGKIPQQWGVFEWNAQLHQIIAILLVIVVVSIFFIHTRRVAAL